MSQVFVYQWIEYLFCQPFLFDVFNLKILMLMAMLFVKSMNFVLCRYDIEGTRNVSGIIITTFTRGENDLKTIWIWEP